jgi:hypothetical protein
LGLLANLVEVTVVASPQPVLVELTTAKRVEVLYSLILTPPDEVAEPVLMPLQ